MFDNFYDLTGRPFQLTPDPAFYFESQTHRKALSYLGYGLAQGEGFVVITGEVGAGKSTLVAHLMATIDPARLTAAQVVTSRLDGEEIIHVVAQAFGLMIDGHDKASALGAIENFLHDEARAGRRCLLIVDESQNLSVEALEELRMLSNFQLGAHPLLQTLLLGQPEFRQTLAKHSGLEQLRQRVIASHHLGAMELPEVQQYVEHRLKCVGWAGKPSFDQRVFAEIYDATGGIPRRVNQVLSRLLLLGSVEERSHIDGPLVRKVLDELGEDCTVGLVQSEPEPKLQTEPVVETAPAEEVSQFAEVKLEPEPEAEPAPETAGKPSFGKLPLSDPDEETSEPEATSEPAFEAPAEQTPAVPQPFAGTIGDSDDPFAAVDKGFAKTVPEEAEEAAAAEPAEPEPTETPVETVVGVTMAEIEALLADREAKLAEQIAELQQAVVELADARDENEAADRNAGDQIEALGERIAALEARVIEQDRTIRHTLTMLIEWIETGEGSRDAA